MSSYFGGHCTRRKRVAFVRILAFVKGDHILYELKQKMISQLAANKSVNYLADKTTNIVPSRDSTLAVLAYLQLLSPHEFAWNVRATQIPKNR